MTAQVISAIGVNSSEHGLIVVLRLANLGPAFPTKLELKAFQAAIRGASYDVVKTRHYVPRAAWLTVRAQILAYGCVSDMFTIQEDKYVTEWMNVEVTLQSALTAQANARADEFDARLRERGLTLRGYQREGIAWLSVRRVGLLTDEMGTGKTLQSLCALPDEARAIVVCPASLRGYWRDEIGKWRPDLTPLLVEGRGSFVWPAVGQVVVCSDAALVYVDTTLEALGPEKYGCFLISDEAHMFKGERSNRTKNMETLCGFIRKHDGWTIGLTGTPLLNRPEELWQLAKVFGCSALGWGSEPAFKRAFEVGEDFGYGPTYGTPKQEAREGLARISLRRTREQVLPELPPKSYQYIPVILPRVLRNRLDKAQDQIGSTLNEWENHPEWAWHDVMPKFDKYAAVSRDLAALKIDSALAWVEQHEAANVPVVVFSAHREAVDLLAKRDRWTSITGDTPVSGKDSRTARVDAFQAGKHIGIAGTIGAMGTGHTLTAACHALFVDQAVVPGLNLQAEDRVYRLGQKLPVLISILVADHPLERRIQAILQKKLELTRSAMGESA